MKLEELIYSNECFCKIPDMEIEHCTCDFRTCNEKSLLFMLPGVNFDTKKLLYEYEHSNAAAIITENPELFSGADGRILGVKNAGVILTWVKCLLAWVFCSLC